MIIREKQEADKIQILFLHEEFEREFFPEIDTEVNFEETDLEERY